MISSQLRGISRTLPSETRRPDVVCILGMHRSGTSLLTRILNLIGVDLGPDELLVERGEDNPKGFWENYDIRALNEALLKRYGGSWHEPPALPPGWETSAVIEDLKERAQILIQEQFAKAQIWGWKDPRSCLTLPFWQQLLPDMRYVICLRNPADVAHSLQHRDRFSAKKSSNLWLTYVNSALEHTEGKPRLVVFYEDLMDDCLSELHHLADFLGKTEQAEQDDVKKAVQEFIEEGLQHYNTSIAQATAGSSIDLRAKALYIAQRITVSFGRKASVTQDGLDGQVEKALDILSQYSFRAAGQANPLIEQLAVLEDQLTESRNIIRAVQTRLLKEARERDIISAVLAEREEGLKVLSQQYMGRNAALRQLYAELAEQHRALQLSAEGAEERVGVLSAQLLDSEIRLKRIMDTLAWRLLSVYGRAKSRFLYRLFGKSGRNEAQQDPWKPN